MLRLIPATTAVTTSISPPRNAAVRASHHFTCCQYFHQTDRFVCRTPLNTDKSSQPVIKTCDDVKRMWVMRRRRTAAAWTTSSSARLVASWNVLSTCFCKLCWICKFKISPMCDDNSIWHMHDTNLSCQEVTLKSTLINELCSLSNHQDILFPVLFVNKADAC